MVGSGEVWLSSVGDTGAIFSFRDGAWLSITREDGLPGGAVTSIGQSLDSAFWLVIPDAGVARYEPNLGQVGTIHGRLLGRDMRQILAGTPVHIERESGEGQFTIRAQEAGGYRVRAFPGNYRVSVGGGQVRQVVVDSGKSTRLDFADIEFANTVIAGRGKTVRAGTGNRKGAFRNFSVADGLTSPQIFDIHQDQAGDIWFSTDVSGVTRFDGTYLTTFTTDDGMPDNWVNSIESDSKGNLWFGTRSGACKYDGATFTTYTSVDGLADDNVGFIHRDLNGHLWFGAFDLWKSRPGLTKFDGNQFTSIDQFRGSRILSLDSDTSGSLWIATGNGVYRYADNRAVRVSAHALFSAVLRDTRGDVWFNRSPGSGANEVLRLRGNSISQVWSFDNINYSRSFIEDKEGNLWFGSDGLGVFRFDEYGLHALTTIDGLIDDHVTAVFEDRAGDIWIGTDQGISHYAGNKVTNFLSSTEYPLMDFLIEEDAKIWVSTLGNGIRRIDGDSVLVITTEQGLAHDEVFSILQERKGHVWFATHGGASRFDGSRFETFDTEDGLLTNDVHDIFQASSGDLWFLFRDPEKYGVSRYDGEAFHSYTGKDGLPGQPTSVLEAGDRIWFGIQGQGVWGFDGTRFEMRRMPGFGRMFTDSHGQMWCTASSGVWKLEGSDFVRSTESAIPSSMSDAIRDSDGTFWFTHWGSGVSFLEGDSVKTFTTDDGLASKWVGSVVEDSRGVLWFGTQGGVSRYDGETFQSLYRRDGLAGDNVNRIHVARNGDIWILYRQGGLTKYRSSKLNPVISVVNVIGDRSHGVVDQISVPSTGSRLRFEFRARSFATPPGRMVYRYRMGEQEDWQQTRNTHAEYESLLLGEYVFQVTATDLDMNQPEESSEVSVVVHWPYDRLLFSGGLAIAVLLLAFQTTRVVRRGRHLRDSNAALSDANRELFSLNVELQREKSVERIRAEVQSMNRAQDFERVLSMLANDLREMGLHFDTCGIDALTEPAESPSMEYFEQHGFGYTSYTIDPDGRVDRESFQISAPFPPVNRETIERFIEGEPWLGMSGETSIIEVPASGYGRLRITASERQNFGEEEVHALQDFAEAIALGYARYLDFQNLEQANREIQEATERKSAFLASMSHELRTPMNAIKGFTNLVLRRGKDQAWERNEENLTKVSQASDHLLTMIDDLLDLSKIEAGRMDVNPERFDVRGLVESACDTVSPLIQDGVELRRDVADDIGDANTDKARLQQMVINLLSNAIKFTDSGSVTVSAATEAGQLIVAVTDTGKGIPSDELPTIFDEYRQAEGSESSVQKGTGLGLSITKKFAELLGGTIGVDSEVGKGSTFTLRVPVEYPNPNPQ